MLLHRLTICFLAGTLFAGLAVAANKRTVVVRPASAYAAISFDSTEAELVHAFPEVKCQQMPNPAVRMCHAPTKEGDDVTFLFMSGKLINMSGRTRSEHAQPRQLSCPEAQTRFRECQNKSGDAFVNCLAMIHAPEGCSAVVK